MSKSNSSPKIKLHLIFLEINEFADMDDDEFADEHLGEVQEPEDEPSMTRTIGDRTVYLGEIPYDGENTPEEIAELEEIYAAIDRQNLPSTYDSRAKGKYIIY